MGLSSDPEGTTRRERTDPFGEVVRRRQRRYALKAGCYPLDEKLRMDRCATGFHRYDKTNIDSPDIKPLFCD